MSIGGAGAINMAHTLFNVPAKATRTAGTSSTKSTASASSMTKQLSTPQLFLKLLMAELQHENPTHPTTASTILQQTAELSQIESVTTMTTTLDKQRRNIQASDATGLIGRQVSATVTGQPVSGTVTRVLLASTGTPVLEVGTSAVPLASVTAVSAVAPTATTSTPGAITSTPGATTSTTPA